jgi:hypothetical protein
METIRTTNEIKQEIANLDPRDPKNQVLMGEFRASKASELHQPGPALENGQQMQAEAQSVIDARAAHAAHIAVQAVEHSDQITVHRG